MKDDIINRWEPMTTEQIRAWTQSRIQARKAAEKRRLDRLMNEWIAPVREAERASQSCAHNETVELIRDAVEDGDTAIEGGVELRCIACRRMVGMR